MDSKTLYLNTDFNAKMSFQMAAILSERTYPWYYERFINLIMYRHEAEYAMNFINNKQDESYIEFMSERRVLSVFTDKIDGVREMLINNIDGELYTYIWVDKYYIDGNDSFLNNHFVHPVLVYGYNKPEEYFLCADIDPYKGYTVNRLSFRHCEDALHNVIEYKDIGGNEDTVRETVVSFKIRNIKNAYDFRLSVFQRQLFNYINGQIDEYDENNLYLGHNEWNHVYGIKVYGKFMEAIENLNNNMSVGFASLYGLLVHKKCLVDRFNYIKDKYVCGEWMDVVLKDLNSVYDIIAKIISICMKYNTIDGISATAVSRNPKFISKAIEFLKQAFELELSALESAYGYLSAGLIGKEDYKDKIDVVSEIRGNNIKLVFDRCRIRKIIVSNRNGRYVPQLRIHINNACNNIREDYNNQAAVTCTPEESGEVYIELIDRGFDINNLKVDIFTLPVDFKWAFNYNLYQSCINMSNQNGRDKLSAMLYGNDPFLINNVFIDADVTKYIYIKCKTACEFENAQFYFSTMESGFSEDKSKKFKVIPGMSYTYCVDMSDTPHWKGIINKMRFDPVCIENKDDSGTCEVDYIQLSDKPPVYSSEKDFAPVQGINGWLYYCVSDGIIKRELTHNKQDNKWIHPLMENIYIDNNSQSSCMGFASVRSWTCLAGGQYEISVSYRKQNNTSVSTFQIKHNNSVIYNDSTSDESDREVNITRTINRADIIDFCFSNIDAEPVCLDNKIKIKK